MENIGQQLEQIDREQLAIEIRRQVRFFWEERQPDNWPRWERIDDALNMLEVEPFDLFIPRRGMRRNPPPLVAWIADEFGRQYDAARKEYKAFLDDFLTRLGPEMDI